MSCMFQAAIGRRLVTLLDAVAPALDGRNDIGSEELH
jgi:hypothetical protein